MPIKNKKASIKATIIFFDVVSFSKKDENSQFSIVNHMNDVVKKFFINEDRFNDTYSNFKTFNKTIDVKNKIFEPCLFATGDGFLIVLDHNASEPTLLKEYALIAIEFAITLIKEAKQHKVEYNVRFGINHGDIIGYHNINGISFAGDVLNDTQRIMDLGDADHILFSEDVYNSLSKDICDQMNITLAYNEHLAVKNKELTVYRIITFKDYHNQKNHLKLST